MCVCIVSCMSVNGQCPGATIELGPINLLPLPFNQVERVVAKVTVVPPRRRSSERLCSGEFPGRRHC